MIQVRSSRAPGRVIVYVADIALVPNCQNLGTNAGLIPLSLGRSVVRTPSAKATYQL